MNTNRYHIDVLVPGRADGLVIKTAHVATLGDAQDYEDRIAKQNLYVTEIKVCNDPECRDHDITRPDGKDG